MNSIDYSKIYEENNEAKLPKYNFESQSYNFRARIYLRKLSYSHLYRRLFGYTKIETVDYKFGSKILNVDLINKEEFTKINLKTKAAEKFSDKIDHYLYYKFKYKILPTKNLKKDRYSNKKNVNGIYAYVTEMNFYSDKNHTNLVHTIYPNKEYKDYIVNETKNDKNSTTNKDKNTHKNNYNNRITYTKKNIVNKGSAVDKNNKVENLIRKAKSGDKYSQNKLGNYYFSGKKVRKDITKAKYWFKKAAENGFVTSQENLGAVYFKEKKFANALIWYTKAAQSNHSRAQFMLGYMYRKGVGVKKSRRKAKKWWKKSCSLGYKESCNEVKKMNSFGNAILKSLKESIENRN